MFISYHVQVPFKFIKIVHKTCNQSSQLKYRYHIRDCIYYMQVFQVLYRYRTGIVQVLYRYRKGIVNVLHRYRICIVQISLHHIVIVQVSYKCRIGIIQLFSRYHLGIVQAFCWYRISIVQVLYKYGISIVLVSFRFLQVFSAEGVQDCPRVNALSGICDPNYEPPTAECQVSVCFFPKVPFHTSHQDKYVSKEDPGNTL